MDGIDDFSVDDDEEDDSFEIAVTTDTEEDGDMFSKLDEALGRLPWEQRSAFVLIEIQELTYAEAAVIEDVPVGTVKSRVSRAKRQIRECLTTNPKNK